MALLANTISCATEYEFCSFFMYLKLKKECVGRLQKGGENKVGIGFQG